MTAVAYAASVFFGMLAICFILLVCMAGLAWIVSLARQAGRDVVEWARKWIGYFGLLRDLSRWTRRYRYQRPGRVRAVMNKIRNGGAGL